MKLSACTAAVAVFSALATAAPSPVEKRVTVSITFYGANGESYSVGVPTDRNPVKIDNPLVVTRLSSGYGGFCDVTGAQGEVVTFYSAEEKTLETPQKIVSASCGTI
ncbi:hypothetical protein BDV59DRAFT_6492 [Aspergillus ambiguus]|uniref:uncharacterized protein n=1 Tax=Aspergillus ambiguus TaxID=176160 RepID=UPI003CCE08AB